MGTVEISGSNLVFHLPEVHPQARMRVKLHRTLRIPDDGKRYALPPSFGGFPMERVDDQPDAPALWKEHGGVMVPMHQSEALWMAFSSESVDSGQYQFAVKIAAGKVSAVTGDPWKPGLTPGDYVVVPKQPWIDGYVVEKGVVRQFVATPLGAGFTAEAQITGEEKVGGIQIEVFAMKRDAFERRFPKRNNVLRSAGMRKSGASLSTADEYSRGDGPIACAANGDMGLSAGGTMHQEIFADMYSANEWDTTHSVKCFVHLTNSLVWRAITGKEAPSAPITAKEYEKIGYPWFSYYDEGPAVDAAEKLKGLKSVKQMSEEKKMPMLPENQSVTETKVVALGPGQVRQGSW